MAVNRDIVNIRLGEIQMEVDLDTLKGQRLLAECISSLNIPEKTKVHAEKMKACKEDEYSLSFFEASEQLKFLLNSDYSLEDAVATIADEIPSVEDIPYALKWGNCITVTRKELLEHAAKFQNMNNESTDGKLAKRILSKKASVADWKLYALRFADFNARTAQDGRNFWAFFADEERAIRECAELKKYTRKVAVKGSDFNLERPHHPPWTDVGIWEEEWFGRGFGYKFAPERIFGESDSSDGDGDSSYEPDDEQIAAAYASAGKDYTPCRVASDATSAPVVHSVQDTTKLPSAEWPELPKNQTNLQLPTNPTGGLQQKQNLGNVWTAGQKKKFMNNGIAKSRNKLSYTPPASTETDFQIDVEKAFSIKDVWGFSLLGQYVGRHPGHKAIKAMMDQWGVTAKYKIEEGWMIFSFDSEEDQEKVLIEGPYMIHGRPMLLKHVPDKFAFTNEDFATVPLWMRLYGLGSRFWTEEFLGGIASYVGKPLYLDPVTDSRKRNSYARVLVEVNLAEPVVRKVPLKFSDGDSFSCRIQLENEPKFCKHCCAFGHNIGECSFVNTSAAHKAMARQNVVASSPVAKVQNGAVYELHTATVTSAQHVPAAPTVATEVDMEKLDVQIQQATVIGETEGISGVKGTDGACPTIVGENRFALLVQDSGLMEKGDAQTYDACMTAGATMGPQNVSLVDGNDLAASTDMGEQRESLVAADRETSQSQAPPNLPQSTQFGKQASGRKKGSKV